MNRPARFTQAELARALRAAKAEGARVRVRDGAIEFDFIPISGSQAEKPAETPALAPVREFRL